MDLLHSLFSKESFILFIISTILTSAATVLAIFKRDTFVEGKLLTRGKILLWIAISGFLVGLVGKIISEQKDAAARLANDELNAQLKKDLNEQKKNGRRAIRLQNLSLNSIKTISLNLKEVEGRQRTNIRDQNRQFGTQMSEFEKVGSQFVNSGYQQFKSKFPSSPFTAKLLFVAPITVLPSISDSLKSLPKTKFYPTNILGTRLSDLPVSFVTEITKLPLFFYKFALKNCWMEFRKMRVPSDYLTDVQEPIKYLFLFNYDQQSRQWKASSESGAEVEVFVDLDKKNIIYQITFNNGSEFFGGLPVSVIDLIGRRFIIGCNLKSDFSAYYSFVFNHSGREEFFLGDSNKENTIYSGAIGLYAKKGELRRYVPDSLLKYR